MVNVPLPTDLLDRIAAIERELAEVRKRSGIGNAVSRGVFRFVDATGATKVYFGPLVGGGTGWLFYRHNGELVFSLEGANPADQFYAFRDEHGNIIMSDDAATGQGLATPYIPLWGLPTRHITTNAGESTTSATFAPLWTVQGHKQHPRIRVGVWAKGGDATTAGELRLRAPDTGIVVAGPIAVPANTNTWYDLVGAVAGDHLSGLKLDVECRRTAGASPMWTSLAYLEGIQS